MNINTNYQIKITYEKRGGEEFMQTLIINKPVKIKVLSY